jgi:hypothetical protein
MSDTRTITPEEQRRLLASLRAQIARVSDEQVHEGRPRHLARKLTQTELDKSQIRNLENLAYTTDKISDITDLLKKLIGRDTRGRRWAKDGIGQEIIGALEGLRGEADTIAANQLDADLPRRVHLELCREFVKHLAAEFIYQKKGE